MSGVTTDNDHAVPTETTLLLLSARTLADRLGVSLRTLWRLRAARKLPTPVKIGGSIRWRADDIDDWIRTGCPDFGARTTYQP
jgi:excisionase family DNA binding protein